MTECEKLIKRGEEAGSGSVLGLRVGKGKKKVSQQMMFRLRRLLLRRLGEHGSACCFRSGASYRERGRASERQRARARTKGQRLGDRGGRKKNEEKISHSISLFSMPSSFLSLLSSLSFFIPFAHYMVSAIKGVLIEW